MSKVYKVAVVGATGAVGRTLVALLENRHFPVGELRLLATEKSAGTILTFQGRPVKVEALKPTLLKGLDIVWCSAGSTVSQEYAPIAVSAGAVVVDNSSAWRMDPEVPLVVPEVNPQALATHKGLIANPNCSTIQMVVVLKPLHDVAKIKRVVVSTYQAVSGKGQQGMAEFQQQIAAYIAGETVTPKTFPYPIAFNPIPHIDDFAEHGYTKEEWKIIRETRKILGLPRLPVTATAVRVPVLNAHSESVNVEFEKKLTVAEARQILSRAPGVALWDEPERLRYPLATLAQGTDACWVGRVREDPTVPSGLHLWIVADNLRKGAALNAVQIAEHLISSSWGQVP